MSLFKKRQNAMKILKIVTSFKMKLWLIILNYISYEAQANFSSKFGKLANAGMTFDQDIASYVEHSLIECSKLCAQTPGCYYISYHSDQTLCNLHAGNGMLISSPGRTLYFKMFDESGKILNDLMMDATAFQSVTFEDFDANLALDSDTNGDLLAGSCAHTGNGTNTYWLMQLGTPGVVGKVEIYLRTDYVYRNTNRSVLVAQSYDDGVNNVGIECGRYVGPVISTPPFMLSFSCPLPIYGEFVRITMLSDDYMEVCEVFVYTQ